MENRLPITAKHNDLERITSLASTAARIKRVEKHQAGVQHWREKGSKFERNHIAMGIHGKVIGNTILKNSPMPKPSSLVTTRTDDA